MVLFKVRCAFESRWRSVRHRIIGTAGVICGKLTIIDSSKAPVSQQHQASLLGMPSQIVLALQAASYPRVSSTLALAGSCQSAPIAAFQSRSRTLLFHLLCANRRRRSFSARRGCSCVSTLPAHEIRDCACATWSSAILILAFLSFQLNDASLHGLGFGVGELQRKAAWDAQFKSKWSQRCSAVLTSISSKQSIPDFF